MLEDKALIWKVKHGSRDALCNIYEKYEDDLLTLAINLTGDVAAAEDVVHDVFARFTRSVDKFSLTGSLKSYLATCVANLARDRVRKKQRQKAVSLDDPDVLVSSIKEPAQLAIFNEELTQLAGAIGQLAYEQREVIILHLQSGMTFKAIAESQDVSINTIKSRYRYALDRLRTILNSERKDETDR